MKQRMTGVFILLSAWFMYHAGVHVPLQQMKAHAPEIKVWVKSLVFLPLAIGTGLYYLFRGEELDGRFTGLLAAVGVLLFALGIWLWVWFEHQEDLYGYGTHAYAAQPPLRSPVPVEPYSVVPNPPRDEPVAPSVAPPQLPTEELHDLIAATDGTGEAHGFMVPGNKMRRALPNVRITDPIRVAVKKGDDLFPTGCSRYRVTLQQGGDMVEIPGNRQALRPYSVNLSYSLNYCLDRSIPTGGYDVHIES